MGAAFPPCVAPTPFVPAPRGPSPPPPLAAREPIIASRRRAAPARHSPARSTAGSTGSAADASPHAVGPRQPCPCGSGRRYKNCHGATGTAGLALTRRPFADLPAEPEWVALREIVPAATFEVRLRPDVATPEVDRVTVATLLPMAWPALRRRDGAVLVGLQVPARSGDVSRDLAVAIEDALAAAPGSSITPAGLPAPGRRLQDLLADGDVEVTVHDGFDFWLEGAGDVDDEVRASMERANAAVVPTERLASVPAAYWCRMTERNHLRWVLPYDEEPALDALARLFVDDGLSLGAGTRYVGSFRAHGLLVPVWDLPSGTAAADIEEPVARLAERLAGAVADGSDLDDAAQRARRALAGRQLTIR